MVRERNNSVTKRNEGDMEDSFLIVTMFILRSNLKYVKKSSDMPPESKEKTS